jgi:hypothetical protein
MNPKATDNTQRGRLVSFILEATKLVGIALIMFTGHRCSGYRVCQNRHSNSFSVVWTLLLDVFSALVRVPTTQA